MLTEIIEKEEPSKEAIEKADMAKYDNILEEK